MIVLGKWCALFEHRSVRLGLLLCFAGLLAVTFLTIPPAPRSLEDDIDASLNAVLGFAQQRNLQFGPDFIFTYGPLGFLTFCYFSPETAGLRLAADVGLCFTTALGLCLLALRLRPVSGCLLVAWFVWVGGNAWPRTDLVIDTGLLCWALLCLIEKNRRLVLALTTFTALAAFSALAKTSFLFVSSAGVALVACGLAAKRQGRPALAVILGYGAGFMLGWVAAGQNLVHLWSFAANSLAVVRGYNESLAMEGAEWVNHCGWPLALLVLATGLCRMLGFYLARDAAAPEKPGLLLARFALGIRRMPESLAMAAWMGLLGFTVWKHGFVRVDASHPIVFFSFVPVLIFALAIFSVPRGPARTLARSLGAISVLWALTALMGFYFPSFGSSLRQPATAFAEHLECLLRPGEYWRKTEDAMESNRREAQLPHCRKIIGQASVDVFGQHQGYALLNDLNYRWRPVCQSYVACTPRLMELNERVYLSSTAPEYVLFRLAPMDGKIPALEDARVLRALLIDYEPVTTEKGLLLLKRRSSETPRLTLAREGTTHPGELVDLTDFGDSDLWIEINLVPNLSGRVRQFLCRPPPVRLAAWAGSGDRKLLLRRRAPAPMLAAGFLASPLLVRNEDVQALYAGSPMVRPSACSVELPPGEASFWKQSVQYRLYRIENRLGRSASTGSPARPETTQVQDEKPAPQRPFTVFRQTRWRPDRPAPGNFQETLAYGLFVLLPMLSAVLMTIFIRRLKRRQSPVGWSWVVLGNALGLLVLVSPLPLVGETYFRFFCDTTDSLGYTRVCERWVQRHWKVNAAGCRDNIEYAPAISAGKRRISFVGDSFTAGHGVKEVEDRFANQVRRAHPEWEVHVLANVGLDTGPELVLLRKLFAKSYQADQVVLVYCLNDVGDLLPEQGLVFEGILASLDGSGWLVRNSYLVNFVYHRYKAARNPYLKKYFPFVREAYRGPVWEQQKQRLRALRDLVQEHGGHLSVVTFPFLHELGPAYEDQFVHDELNALWRELGVPHLDLLPVFKDLTPAQVTVNPYDAHPNEYAHRLAAAAIGRWLESLEGGPLRQPPRNVLR